MLPFVYSFEIPIKVLNSSSASRVAVESFETFDVFAFPGWYSVRIDFTAFTFCDCLYFFSASVSSFPKTALGVLGPMRLKVTWLIGGVFRS